MLDSGPNNGFAFQTPASTMSNPHLVDELEQSFQDCLALLTNQEFFNVVDSEESKASIEQTIQKFLDNAHKLETFFLQKRFLLSIHKPEQIIKEDIAGTVCVVDDMICCKICCRVSVKSEKILILTIINTLKCYASDHPVKSLGSKEKVKKHKIVTIFMSTCRNSYDSPKFS